MNAPQSGIFALSDSAHIFLEFSLNAGKTPLDLATAVASIHEPRTTVGGVNFVVGFRPQLFREIAPDDTPEDARSFDIPVNGIEGFVMPATQLDLWLWFAGASYDIIWDTALAATRALRDVATLDREVDGWSYRHSRDLTGFEDGTENPNLLEAPDVATVGEGRKGEGASILLFQKWKHFYSWFELSTQQQEAVMGRTKLDSIEFDEEQMPPTAHVARAKDVVDGEERDIFRRNVPYGNVMDHGTVFVGFSAEQSRLQRMLERMAGAEDGIRDALTRFTTPLTGAYYVVPSVTALQRFQ
jgi:putative iron-dependent peroxidase